MGISAIAVGQGIIRLDQDRFVEGGDRLLVSIQGEIGVAQVVMGLGVTGANDCRRIVIGDRRPVIEGDEMHSAAIVIGDRQKAVVELTGLDGPGVEAYGLTQLVVVLRHQGGAGVVDVVGQDEAGRENQQTKRQNQTHHEIL